MRYLLMLSFILSPIYAYPMGYLTAPFKSAYSTGLFLLGSKTYLEIEIDSLLKKMTIPPDAFTTHEKLERFVQTEVEKHINEKAKSSKLFLVYFGAIAVYYRESLIQKIENNINIFVTKELQKKSDLSDDFFLIDEETK